MYLVFSLIVVDAHFIDFCAIFVRRITTGLIWFISTNEHNIFYVRFYMSRLSLVML